MVFIIFGYQGDAIAKSKEKVGRLEDFLITPTNVFLLSFSASDAILLSLMVLISELKENNISNNKKDYYQACIPPANRRKGFGFFHTFIKKFSIHSCSIKSDKNM